MLPKTIDGQAAMGSSLARFWGLERYTAVMHSVRECDVRTDEDFQRLFNGFYQVRRNAAWREAYYDVMEKEKDEESPSFERVIRELYERTGNIEASFSSKMVATLDPSMPIWDRLVLEALDLHPKGRTDAERLDNAAEVYGTICAWYGRYLKTRNAGKNIRLFDEFLPAYAWLSPTKKVDFLLWASR